MNGLKKVKTYFCGCFFGEVCTPTEQVLALIFNVVASFKKFYLLSLLVIIYVYYSHLFSLVLSKHKIHLFLSIILLFTSEIISQVALLKLAKHSFL